MNRNKAVRNRWGRRLMVVALIVSLMFGMVGCFGRIGDWFTRPSLDSEYEAGIAEVFHRILEEHYSEPTAEQLYEGALRGMFASLEDPYSRFMNAEEFAQYQADREETFVGIGVRVQNIEESVFVIDVYDNSPAERAGIIPGDVITHVDGEDYRGRMFNAVVQAVLGDEGTEVEIGVQRAGAASTFFMTMVREEIDTPSATFETLDVDDQRIGVLNVLSFGPTTHQTVDQKIQTFEQGSHDGLIIDMRNNPGGSLNTLVRMLDLFLSSDASSPFFTIDVRDATQPDGWDTNVFHGTSGGERDYPIVILVNGFSASASEVFAAVMHEYGGHDVVGTTTFGNGTSQFIRQMAAIDGAATQITSGIWYTTDGNLVEGVGYEPSVFIEQNPYFDFLSLYIPEGKTFAHDVVADEVKTAQMILNALGYDVREDGYFDQDTETALKAFQGELFISKSGILDSETAAYLNNAAREFRQDRANDSQFSEALRRILNEDS